MPRNLSPFSFQFSPSSARYYNSALSIWLSVDPMSDKYPSTSPYTYCANNPVKLVDPDGEWPEDRARRFMKKYKSSCVYYEKDGGVSVQYEKPNDRYSNEVVVRVKQFKMNIFEKFFSKIQHSIIQRFSEKIAKKNTHRGGIWGITKDPNTYPPGQDEVTDSQILQVNLDEIQQLYVPKPYGWQSHSNSSSSDNEQDENSKVGTSGEFIIFYNKKQKDKAAAYGIPYNGSYDSIKKRNEAERKGDRIALIQINRYEK